MGTETGVLSLISTYLCPLSMFIYYLPEDALGNLVVRQLCEIIME